MADIWTLQYEVGVMLDIEIEACFDDSYQLRHVDTIMARFGL